MFPEYRMAEDDFRAFLRDRKGAVVGRKLAQTHGWKVGDAIPLKGTIFPGNWEFVVRAIYDAGEAKTDTSQFFFHWEYLNETLRQRAPQRASQVGIFVVEVSDVDRAAEVSEAIDKQFRNSIAETQTETEQAFQIGFVKQTEALLIAVRIVSFVVIFIILAVMDWRTSKKSSQGSVGRDASRSFAFRTVNVSPRSSSNSSHATGMATGAPARARAEKTSTAVAPGPFRR